MSDVMIEARNLSKTYGSVRALEGASFEVRKGEVIGFLGPNGAGKTTTMKILTCFIAPTDGTAKVNGCDIWEDPIGARRAIGYLPEHTPLYTEMLVQEYLEFMGKMRGFKGVELQKRVRKVVDQTALRDKLGSEIRSLSKGYRQRVGIAQALVHEPPVLILDEPMSGLDPNQASDMRDLITQIGEERTVVYSTHNLAEVQAACKRVLIVAGGKIVADDTPEELSARAGKSRYFVTISAPDGQESASIASKYTKVDGVETAHVHSGDTAKEVVVEIAPKGDDDLRARLFGASVDAGFTMLGLERKEADLESIFRELTTQNGSASK